MRINNKFSLTNKKIKVDANRADDLLIYIAWPARYWFSLRRMKFNNDIGVEIRAVNVVGKK